MKKDKILWVIFNSLTDSEKDINVENPDTYVDRLLVYKRNAETGEIYMQKVGVDSLIQEKEEQAIAEANRKQGITLFSEFLVDKFGEGEFFLLPYGKTVCTDELEKTK